METDIYIYNVNARSMCVEVHLCTSRGCSDRVEPLKVAAPALQIIVACIPALDNLKYDHFVVLTYKELSSSLASLQSRLSLCTFCGNRQATKRSLKITKY